MRLFNKTRCPDLVLKPLLAMAAESVGVKTSGVVVKVTQGRGNSMRGRAADWTLVYLDHLQKKKRKVKRNVYRRASIRANGYIELILPKPKRLGLFNLTHEKLVYRFYRLAQHEWAHIKDFHNKVSAPTPRTPGGRRVRWGNRPCEKYAQKEVMFASKLHLQNNGPLLALERYFVGDDDVEFVDSFLDEVARI